MYSNSGDCLECKFLLYFFVFYLFIYVSYVSKAIDISNSRRFFVLFFVDAYIFFGLCIWIVEFVLKTFECVCTF